jgi:hypothetical protein
MAERIQRKRTKGWRMPEGAVYVGRPSRWGNPFRVGDRIAASDPRMKIMAGLVPGGVKGLASVTISMAQQAVDAYFEFIVNTPALALAARDALCGKTLVCWCPLDQPCHADVLLELAG